MLSLFRRKSAALTLRTQGGRVLLTVPDPEAMCLIAQREIDRLTAENRRFLAHVAAKDKRIAELEALVGRPAKRDARGRFVCA